MRELRNPMIEPDPTFFRAANKFARTATPMCTATCSLQRKMREWAHESWQKTLAA
jgi:hypothetical protein